jgi:chemotaxis-related protein WspD
MKPESLAVLTIDDCWNRIGIAGDRSCPELERHIHCRNCPVFAEAAKGFFDRPAPEGYLAEWSRLLAVPTSPADSKDLSILIFRLGNEWLALRTHVVVEVTTPRLVHRIPHRSNDILVGLVNLRGQLQLQVSLHGLLGVDTSSLAVPTASASEHGGAPDMGHAPRLIVIKRDGHSWVFLAEEVLGVHRFAVSRLIGVPSNLANPENSFSQAVIHWREKSVGYLDDQRVFATLKGLAQLAKTSAAFP